MGLTVKIKTMLITACGVTVGVLLIAFSEQAKNGVISGLILCGNTVIPSLFLFTALALFLSSSGALNRIGRLISPVSTRVLGINGTQTAVLLLSLVSGYPVGAKMLNNLYKRGEIGRKKAVLTLSFCTNPGPAFVILAVGGAVLGSQSDGKRLFLAIVLSSLTTALILSFWLKKYGGGEEANTVLSQPALSDCFVTSVADAGATMLTVSAFVVAFSGIGGVLAALGINEEVKRFVMSMLEVTVGVGGRTRSELGIVAFFISFGGISVHMQVMSAARDIAPKFWSVFLGRVAGGLVASGYIALFEKISPRTVSAVQMQGTENVLKLSADPVTVGALILMSVTLAVSVTQKRNKMSNQYSK